MPSELKKIERRRKAQNYLDEISGREEHVLVIHYSCESFYDRPEGKTPRVTSIAARNFASGQTASFSIHKVAELKGVAFSDIDSEYDRLEKEMLKEFYEFVEKHKSYDWVHWNMRDLCTRQFFIPQKSVFMMTFPSTTVIVLGGHKNSINNRSESEVWCSPCSKVSVK